MATNKLNVEPSLPVRVAGTGDSTELYLIPNLFKEHFELLIRLIECRDRC